MSTGGGVPRYLRAVSTTMIGSHRVPATIILCSGPQGRATRNSQSRSPRCALARLWIDRRRLFRIRILVDPVDRPDGGHADSAVSHHPGGHPSHATSKCSYATGVSPLRECACVMCIKRYETVPDSPAIRASSSSSASSSSPPAIIDTISSRLTSSFVNVP